MTWLKMLLLSIIKWLDGPNEPCPNIDCKGSLFADVYRDIDGQIISTHYTCSNCGKIVSRSSL